jgi:hypothetical protein
MKICKFWPLDYDPEDEVYETLVWDLPGYRIENSLSRKGYIPQTPVPSRFR